MNDTQNEEKRYFDTCKSEFWQEVFALELDYLTRHLAGCRDILSVGCGPAFLEAELAKRGFNVTGLDVSREALSRAPDKIRTVAARAEDMPFPENAFDAVIYVASLQFVEDCAQALQKTVTVLRPGGRLIAMLLNPASAFFKKKIQDPDSYITKIKHTDLRALEEKIPETLSVRGEFFLCIENDTISPCTDREDAALYVLLGTKGT